MIYLVCRTMRWECRFGGVWKSLDWLPAANSADSGSEYRFVATNPHGIATSKVVTLTVR